MKLRKEKHYGKHERDRPLREDDLLKLRREITSETDWKADGANLHIGDEVLACGSAERAELIALTRNGMLQVMNDNVRLRHKLQELKDSYASLTRSFRELWERTMNVKQ